MAISQKGADFLLNSRMADAARGNIDALFELGVSYSTGRSGAEVDLIEAHKWFNLAALSGDTRSQASRADIAIEIPVSYPGAQLDMFYCYPLLARTTGAVIPQTQSHETICGRVYQRWSRHRDWNASCDTLVTHLALVDESMNREVES